MATQFTEGSLFRVNLRAKYLGKRSNLAKVSFASRRTQKLIVGSHCQHNEKRKKRPCVASVQSNPELKANKRLIAHLSIEEIQVFFEGRNFSMFQEKIQGHKK